MKVIHWYIYKDLLLLPKGFIIRHIGLRMGEIAIWVEVDPYEEDMIPSRLLMIPTGTSWKESLIYKGTIHQRDFIWHFYQQEKEREWELITYRSGESMKDEVDSSEREEED